MNNHKIPTAEEFIALFPRSIMQKEQLIEFAKLHVTQALKEASEKATVQHYDGNRNNRETYEVNEESILNSYALENIK